MPRARTTRLPAIVILAALAISAPLLAQAPPDAGGWQGGGQGGGMRGMGIGIPGGGRGLMGTVTEAASDHYTIKTDQGELYRVFFSVNTRINRARQLSQEYKIDGVPTLVVQGRWKTSPAQAKGEGKVLAVVEYLAAQVRAGH